jgi:hypothetical protein
MPPAGKEMTSGTAPALRSTGSGELKQGAQPCWPIVWLWVLSIAQYSYRYILQVNDPATSPLYASTPRPLSAIKYGIFFLFGIYALICLSRRPVLLNRTYRRLLFILGCALVTLSIVALIRLTLSPGDLDQTALCAAQLLPWMASLVFIPFVFAPEHSLTQTLMSFERIIFWIVLPFWLTTVLLALFGIRYPALSYQGLLLRFGGILDDPNGYACLCLLLLIVAATARARYWKVKVVMYAVMVLATLSLTGYVTAIVICLGLLLSHIVKPRARSASNLARQLANYVMVVFLVVLGIAIFQTNATLSAITSLYTAKSNSAATHVSNLLPDEDMWDTSSPIALLSGTGGFSENFYWRILVNFGWIGLVAVGAVMVSSAHFALRSRSRWRYPTGVWIVAVLIGSNGIAYLLTFPVSLIYWSLLGLLICTRNSDDLRSSTR